jgi:multiple sugar transport system substrate-binding protein
MTKLGRTGEDAMHDKTHDPIGIRAALRRRRMLQGGLAAGALLAGTRARAQSAVALTLAVWGGQAEQDAFNALINEYQTRHPNVTVRLEVNGNSGQLYQQVDTRLAGHQAPDLFRIQYQQFGRYAAAHALIDLSPYLDANYGKAFAPAFWQATSYQGKPFALPHHTDTFALYYNADMMQKLGVAPPTSLDASWSWQEFIDVARSVKDKGLAPYGFAMGWQTGAGYRWLPFLYQHGGQLLDDDLRQPQITSKQGVETIAWTQSWFKDGLVPPSTYIKSTEQTQNLFANGTIGLLLNGDWQIPFLQQNMTKFRWDVTYMPRDVGMASDLGGNCLAVSRDTKNPEVAADFLKFMVSERGMWEFVTSAQFLPVRQSLMAENLPFKLRPAAMKLFTIQAGTIPAHLVSTVTMPVFSKINASLSDELDLAFTSGQDPATTAGKIDAAVRAVLG